MQIINETKGKISIHKAGISIILFPGESTNLNRIDVSKIRTYIDYFGLTVKEGKDLAPPFRSPAPKRTIQQIETVVVPKAKAEETETPMIRRTAPVTPEVAEPKEIQSTPEIDAMREEYDDKTAAELRALCKEAGLTVSGNRATLINRLVEHFMG